MAREWRKQGLSGQPFCRSPIGAGSSLVVNLTPDFGNASWTKTDLGPDYRPARREFLDAMLAYMTTIFAKE